MSLGVVTSGMGSWSSGLGALVSGFGTVTPGLQGADSGPSIPAMSRWRSYGGPMSLSSASNATAYSFQNRIFNPDTEAMDTVVFEFASIVNVAAILGMAFSIGGSGNTPGPGGWIRVTFNGGSVGG